MTTATEYRQSLVSDFDRYKSQLAQASRLRLMDNLAEGRFEDTLSDKQKSDYYEVIQSSSDADEAKADIENTLYAAAELGESPIDVHAYREQLAKVVYGEQGTAKTRWGRVKQRYQAGKVQVKLMDLGYDILKKAWADPEAYEQRLKEIQQVQSKAPVDMLKDARGFWEKTFGATADQIPIMWEGMKAGGKGAIIGGTAGGMFAAIAGQLVPGAVAMPEEAVTVPAGIKLGMKVGAAGLAADRIRKLEAGGMFLELMQMEDANGNKIDPKIAVVASHAVGAINGTIEIAEWAVLLKTFGISGKLFNKSAEKVAKKLAAEGTIKNIVAKKLFTYGAALGTETLQEIEQETSSIVFGELAKELNNARKGTDFQRITATDLKERYAEVTAESLRAFGVLALPGPTITGAIEAVALKGKAVAVEGVKAPEKPAVIKTKAAQAIEKIIPKSERESLRDIGYSAAETVKMTLSEAHKALTKKTAPETFTPKEVSAEIAAREQIVMPKVDEEDKNAATIMEHYWREHDERELEINVEARKNQEAITEAMGKTRYEPQVDIETGDMSLAMMLYVDLKEHPAGHKFAENLSKKNREIYDLSQNLPAKVRQVADRITKQNRKAGELAVKQGVIREARENYVAHLWKRNEKFENFYARFRQQTARAKARTLEGGLVEGLAEGLELRVQDITLASQVAQTQVNQAYVGKKLLKMGKDWGLLSDTQQEGWVEVDHPGFTTWKFAGTAEKAKTYGKNFFVTPEGILMERVRVYAEPKLGKTLNKVFSPSVIYKIPGAEIVTRYNAVIKSTILYTSLFHHQAFLRSYAFGSRGLNPKQAYQKGREAIENMTPEVRLLVRNGLTLGRIQDYDPRMVEGKDTIWGKAFALTKPTEKANAWLQRLRRQQETFLFNKLGPYLKTQAALLELRAELIRNKTDLESGTITVDEIASAVANLMNNDFGGLHLGRMGRSQTAQHLMRLIFLAPDWTESNVRSMIDAFRRGETGYMHRMFWGRIAVKGLGATIAFNLLLSAFDDEDFLERYKRAWKEGRLRWLDIDVTPIYKALGGQSDARKYFSLIGHFRDPVKFMTSPGRSLKHKGSVVSRMMLFDFATGQDWAGRKFTTVGELMGISEDGKLAGRLVKYGRGGASPVEPSQLLSWFVYEGRQTMPIPIQNIAAFIAGEADAFDAITKSLGMMTSTTYPERRKKRKPI
jgi:hypothetical protein